MQRRYITVDFFTDRAFGGNPLAVVLDAGGLSTAQMQSIASEFNYSETTFVLPPQDSTHDAQVGIFTVNYEIPFAGHPNVGTAFVLATQAPNPPARLKFEEKAGLVPVEILTEEGRVVGAELTAPQALKKLTPFSAEQAAACISLTATDIRTDRHPPQIVSVGLPFLVVELTSREALRRANQIFDLHPVAVFDDLGDPLPMAVQMIALVAEDTDRSGFLHQRRQFVEFFFGLRRLQMLRIDLVQRLELAAARGVAAVLRGAEPAQMQI
jgi:PhzF family phenazine biosynthesis protein